MRVFVTGASGFIGSAVVPELIAAGHRVVGLVRSDAAARALSAQGAEAVRGTIEDLAVLRAAAAGADAVVHLAFIHDFSRFAEVCRIDTTAVETMGEVLAGSNRPLVNASGLFGLPPGRPAVESDRASTAITPRARTEEAMLALAERGVRTAIVRLPPSVHDAGDHGFVPRIIEGARQHGASVYVGAGENRWPAVHRRDAARLYRLAIERATAGSVLHAVGDEGIPTRAIATAIGKRLGVPVVSKTAAEVTADLGFIGTVFGFDAAASATVTREALGWAPTERGLLADIDSEAYFPGSR